MKLPQTAITLQQQLAEFDLWITPSIREIQDTYKYKSELTKINSLILNLGTATQNFSSVSHCSPEAIASTCIDLIEYNFLPTTTENEQIALTIDIVESLCALLFMVTGKSDNNLKCQFPVYLAQTAGRTDFPQKRGYGSKVTFENLHIGRTVKSERLSKLISDVLVYSFHHPRFKSLEHDAKWLLGKYVATILKDDASVTQFWALGRSYFNLLESAPGTETALLAPIVIFKVRGSVSASGGHIPEKVLRDMMTQWGLESGTDYNMEDVKVLGDKGITDTFKTRAYDFVLPFKRQPWQPHIFIQCQFYAGDSGSVSHKVVDQTLASRPSTLAVYPHAQFIEYLDGAGYYSSLNGDLQHMLGMKNTKDFIQVRSAHVKLRRELQQIGFLTPLEIEHAIFRSRNSSREEIHGILINDGYERHEIDRVISQSIGRGVIGISANTLYVLDSRKSFARQLLIIDIVAQIGASITTLNECAGHILIPGYGATYGALLSDLSNQIDKVAPNSKYSRTDFATDLTLLTESKFIILR